MGRPGLSDEQKARIVEVLSALDPTKLQYRESRLRLAIEMERTERAIENAYRNAK